ncbi:MAG: hypothetical protein LBI39_00695 [Puniceicoccales bacterium]|nr:hypothetical protein [Puniceicoccales bacterium]
MRRIHAASAKVADIRIMWRAAHGVMSINLGAGDKLAAISPVLGGYE